MSEELTPPRFPTMLRKMWSGSEVQAWIDENWNRRAQPEPQAFPPITEQQSQWGRLYTAANALVVQMGYHGSMQADSIEMESLKDKLHDIDGGEWMPGLMPPAQPEPAAPADPLAGMSEMNRTIAYSAASKLREIGYEWTGKEWAAPSVAPEPVADELKNLVFGAIGYASMCWEPRPSTQVFDSVEAKKCAEALIDSILKLFAHPPRAPLTPEQIDVLQRMLNFYGNTPWVECLRPLVSAEGAAK